MLTPIFKNLLIYRLSRDVAIITNEQDFAGQLLPKTGWLSHGIHHPHRLANDDSRSTKSGAGSKKVNRCDVCREGARGGCGTCAYKDF